MGWGEWRSLRSRLNSAEAEAEALLGLAELGKFDLKQKVFKLQNAGFFLHYAFWEGWEYCSRLLHHVDSKHIKQGV